MIEVISMRPNKEFLDSILEYNSETGEFFWKKDRSRCVKAGDKAGSLYPKGYIYICIKGKAYGAHRIAWVMMTGEWPKGVIDHIDRNPSNNSFSNLRDTDLAVNRRNSSVQKNSTSGIKGVTYLKREKRWRASVYSGGKAVFCVHYKEKDEAAEAVKRAYLELGYEY